MIYAIDPGPTQSALVLCTPDGRAAVLGGGYAKILPNEQLLDMLRKQHKLSGTYLAIEMVQSFGMAVGAEVFETCVAIGRFIEAWGGAHRKIYRTTIKGHVCGSAKAKDANVRQALIDRYEPTGGGKVPQIGTKKQPGPLYGFKSHLWSALAVGVTAAETT